MCAAVEWSHGILRAVIICIAIAKPYSVAGYPYQHDISSILIYHALGTIPTESDILAKTVIFSFPSDSAETHFLPPSLPADCLCPSFLPPQEPQQPLPSTVESSGDCGVKMRRSGWRGLQRRPWQGDTSLLALCTEAFSPSSLQARKHLTF